MVLRRAEERAVKNMMAVRKYRERVKEKKWKEEEDGGWDAEEAIPRSGLWGEAEAERMKAVQKPVVPLCTP